MATAQLLSQERGRLERLSSPQQKIAASRRWKVSLSGSHDTSTLATVKLEPGEASHWELVRSHERSTFTADYGYRVPAVFAVKQAPPKIVGKLMHGSTESLRPPPWHQAHELYFSPTPETNLAASFETATSVDPMIEEVLEAFTPLHWPPSPTQAESRPPSDALHHEADDLESSQAVADRFRELADRWEDESMFLSNSGHALALPSYDAIVKLGDQAVSLILKRMQTRGGHWYHALHDITKEDPVDPADWGNVAAMQAAWLRWGRDHGSI